MTKRNLLICFDAFGTLFRPKRPIEEQYTSVAHKFGVGINQDGTSQFNSADVRASFRAAFKHSAKEHPNYGRAVGMGATAWWTKVITDTFTPLLPQSQQGKPLPACLAPALLHRFASAEGYQEPSPSLRSLFDRLGSISGPKAQMTSTSPKARPFDQVIVGVITNSDDRVPDILSSLGLRISPLRYGQVLTEPTRWSAVLSSSRSPDPQASETRDKPTATVHGNENDIDFTCISYDVGHEKPDGRIFQAAEGLAKSVINLTSSEMESADTRSWVKVYVGDEYKHDVEGALKAGWIPVWIPEMDGQAGAGNIVARPDGHYDVVGAKEVDVISLDGNFRGHVKLEHVFGDNGPSHGSKKLVIKCSSLEVLINWLAGRM